MLSKDELQTMKEIDDARKMLEEKFPIEANYGSRSSLWGEGLKAGIVTEELYRKARERYGKLWNYVGD